MSQTNQTPDAYLLDSNMVLGYAATRHHNSSLARSAIRTLMKQNVRLCVSGQVLIEFYAVATRPREVGGLDWKPEGTSRTVDAFRTTFEFLPDSPAIFEEWRRLIEVCQVSGKKAHDARLAATALAHNINHILTANHDDFKRFEAHSLTIVNPATVVPNE